MDHQLERRIDRIVDGLQEGTRQIARVAVALEKLAEAPIVEEPSFAFVCPHCDSVNPPISSLGERSSGPSNEFVLKAECHNCNHVSYGIPMGWATYPNRNSVLDALEERSERNQRKAEATSSRPNADGEGDL